MVIFETLGRGGEAIQFSWGTFKAQDFCNFGWKERTKSKKNSNVLLIFTLKFAFLLLYRVKKDFEKYVKSPKKLDFWKVPQKFQKLEWGGGAGGRGGVDVTGFQ